MRGPWRLFVALELPSDVLHALEKLQADLRRHIPGRAVRWVRPEGIHLTLKFLGDVPCDQVGELQTALDQAVAGRHRFSLNVEGLSCFPNMNRPRVLWVGVTGALKPLLALQQGVEEHIAPLGFSTEERSFSPHLTLARTGQRASRDEMAALGEAVQKYTIGQIASWEVQTVSLMRSYLKPDGATYTQVYTVALEP